MFFKKILELHPQDKSNGDAKGVRDIDILEAFFFQISSALYEKSELDRLLELIARESLHYLRAQRSTIFLLEEKSGILKTQYAFSADPQDEQVSLYEEKEVARKALKQKKPVLLRQPKDFSEFFKYEQRERKITSLMSVPLFCHAKPIRVHSLALIDESRSFSEKDLKLLSALGNQASVAMEMDFLNNEVGNGSGFRNGYEHRLDGILGRLQTMLKKERQRFEGVRVDEVREGLILKQEKTADKEPSSSLPLEGGMLCTDARLPAEDHPRDPAVENNEGEEPPPESEGDSLCFSEDFKSGGMFIRTSNPLDLGEQLILNLDIPDGKGAIGVNCKVVWTNKYGKENKHLSRGMGVKLLSLPPEKKRRIEKYFLLSENRELSSAHWSMSVVN